MCSLAAVRVLNTVEFLLLLHVPVWYACVLKKYVIYCLVFFPSFLSFFPLLLSSPSLPLLSYLSFSQTLSACPHLTWRSAGDICQQQEREMCYGCCIASCWETTSKEKGIDELSACRGGLKINAQMCALVGLQSLLFFPLQHHIGGRVTVLQTTLPNVGPGALKYRDVAPSSVKKVWFT